MNPTLTLLLRTLVPTLLAPTMLTPTMLASSPGIDVLIQPNRLVVRPLSGPSEPPAASTAHPEPLPGAAAAGELLAWQQRNAAQLASVEKAWAALLHRLAGFRPAQFDRQCEGLSSSLARLDETILLPAPDLLVDLYVRRLTKHLHAAAAACRSQQLFNVVYRLEEARSALGEVRWLLAQRARVKSPQPP